MVISIGFTGYQYYTLPLQERPYSPLHASLRPGGVWGHGLGILGSTMMLLLFLYSARRRNLFGLRFGKIRHWLNIHIFFGIMGPIFVTLHTSFKVGGIVAVSYYSMIAVMLSGFVGRYLYVQIPRALSGDELPLKQMEEKNKLMTRLLIENYGVSPKLLKKIQIIAGGNFAQDLKGLSVLFFILRNDLFRPFRIRRLKKQILRHSRSIPAYEITDLIELIKQKSLLMRKMALLSSIQPLFHYWHVVHKPFAYVMVIIMFLHIAVTLLFGARWIF